MEKIIFFILLISLINIIYSQKSCEEIIKSKISEQEMISQFEENMLDIKKDSDK